MKFKKEFEWQLEGLILPQIEINQWIETYNLGYSTIPCKKCQKEKHPMFPIASKDLRGFVYESCECDTSGAFKFAPADKKERQDLIELYSILAASNNY